MIALFSIRAFPHPPPSPEQEKFQALFISKFLDYIKWPSADPHRVIGVLGNTKIYEELKLVASKKAGKFKVIELRGVEEVADCHLVYLGKNKDELFGGLSNTCQSNSVLLVTENSNLAEKGASISFFLEQRKLRFKINKSAIESSNLKISNSLLALGKLVG